MAVWLITGASSGLGRALAQAALARGDAVVGTVRTEADAAVFAGLAPGRAHPALADMRNEAEVTAAVALAEALPGGLDVLVNNAGYGLVARWRRRAWTRRASSSPSTCWGRSPPSARPCRGCAHGGGVRSSTSPR